MFRNYLLTAWKVFMRRKAFTAVNMLCIVLTLVVLMVVTALLEYMFFPGGVERRSDRFLEVSSIMATKSGADRERTSPLGYKLAERYLKPIKSAELVSVLTAPGAVAVYQGDQVTQLMMRRVDANYWKILDFQVLDGQLPTAQDDASGRLVAVINASTARKLYGTVRAAGRSLTVGGQRFAVLGVVADAMHLNSYADVWAPISTYPSTNYRSELFGEFWVLLMAHDRAGLDAIRRDVAQAAKTVQFDDPNEFDQALFWADSKLDTFARGLLDHRRESDSGAGTFLALLAVGMLLFMLLPALNLINLNVGRIMERSGEIGVRKAFGATNGQLVAQFVLENVLLALAGGLVALICAEGALTLIGNAHLIPYLTIHINLAVFGYGLAIAAVFGVLSGVLPAVKMARMDPVHALKGAA